MILKSNEGTRHAPGNGIRMPSRALISKVDTLRSPMGRKSNIVRNRNAAKKGGRLSSCSKM